MKQNIVTIKIVEAARGLLKANGYYVDKLWHVQDVRFICEQYHLPELTDEEAMEVFVIAGDQFDGEAGLSWPQLEKALFTFMRRKATIQQLCENDLAE
ncbi:MAG: hypothetical protein LW823_01090 [Rickettsiales bacterium]|nr:hypothetical protein [Rickettsiales bacterium]